MDIIRNNRFLEDYVAHCVVWMGVGGFEEGYIYNGIPDVGVLFVFKGGMKLAVDGSSSWRDIARNRYLRYLIGL